MLENVEVLYHSSIKIKGNKIIYIDPFKIDKDYNDADIVFITHDHLTMYAERKKKKEVYIVKCTVVVEEHSVVGRS